MKVALLTDTHLGLKQDNPVFLAHMDRFFSNVLFPTLKQRDIKHLVHLGDLVHNRRGTSYSTSQYLKDKLIHRLWNEDIDTHLIVGNHDITSSQTNAINALDGLLTTPTGKDEPWIYTTPKTIQIDGVDIAMVPWISQDIHGEVMEFIRTTPAKIMMGHFEIGGFQIVPGTPCIHGLDQSIFRRFDLVLSGHFHLRTNIGNIYYLGCPYEMAWTDYGFTKGFHLLDLQTREMEFIENPHTIFVKLNYNDEDLNMEAESKSWTCENIKSKSVKVVVSKRKDPKLFQNMIEKIMACDPLELQILDEHIRMESVWEITNDQIANESTQSLIRTVVMNSGLKNVDLERLDKLMQGLYEEGMILKEARDK